MNVRYVVAARSFIALLSRAPPAFNLFVGIAVSHHLVKVYLAVGYYYPVEHPDASQISISGIRFNQALAINAISAAVLKHCTHYNQNQKNGANI